MDQTLRFYDTHTDDFVERTMASDMAGPQGRFLAYIRPGGRILDLGCGAGRDSKAFQDSGYQVEAVDGSEALCAAASRLLGRPVRRMLFKELDDRQAFDAVWASASLLHVPSAEIADVLLRVKAALKPGGIFYLSVKQGTFEGERGGRYFTDYTEDRLCGLLCSCGFQVLECWISKDARPEGMEIFINVIVKETA